MKEYIIVQSDSTYKFEREVERYPSQGFVCQGGVAVYKIAGNAPVLIQAMIKI